MVNKRKKPFRFNYEDIAKLTGHSPDSLKTLVSRNKFNPYKLESLLKFVMSHYIRRATLKQEGGQYTRRVALGY